MPTLSVGTTENIDLGNDSIVIIKCLEVIPGGRTLDTTGFAPEVIKAGHVIIEKTADGELFPLPVSGALPASHTYKGILLASVLTAKPFASILVRGSVNKVAAPYAIAPAVATALPLIRFTED
jgi:hypothetical protein